MPTPEILSKLTAKTTNYNGVGNSRGVDDLGWQDLLLAMQGTEPGKFAFMMYAYADDYAARHDFFAGLFMEIMQDATTQAWIRHRKEQGGYYRAVETMCLIAVAEWRQGRGDHYTQLARARLMGVSRGTWRRKYRDIYQYILSVPSQWESEIMKITSQRLR